MEKLSTLSPERLNELSLIDLCYMYMQENEIESLNIYDFLDYIKPLRKENEEEFLEQAAYFYTNLNLDGRFVCVEDGSWKLRDNLLVEDIKNFVEPSIQKFEGDDEEFEGLEDFEGEEDEEVLDEVDQLVDDEDIDENEDVYDFDDEGVVSRFAQNREDEEF